MEPSKAEANDIAVNYPYFRAFVMAKAREHFEQTLAPLSGDDLEKIAQEENALPLSEFIEEIEKCGPDGK
jgi:hypothetical protein